MSATALRVSLASHTEYVATLSATGNHERLWTAPWEQIQHIQILPGISMDNDVFIVPVHWARTKSHTPEYQRRIDFRTALPPGIDSTSVFGLALMRRAKRIAAIFLLTPVVFEKGNVRQPSKARTWIAECKAYLKVMAWIARNKKPRDVSGACPDGPALFRSLTTVDVADLRLSGGFSQFWKHTAPKLAALFRMGVIDDWPNLDIGARSERSRRATPVPHIARAEAVRFQPLPDGVTARIGHAALWFTEALGPMLLGCVAAARAVPVNASDDTITKRRVAAIERWTAEEVREPIVFPFIVRVPGDGCRAVDLSAWPPQNWRALRGLLALLQTAHIIIVALATAARDSEIMGLERDCLRTVGVQDLLTGYTLKLSDEADGERRDWPLPRIAVVAIQQQQRLADLFAPGHSYLWLSFQNHSDDPREFPDLLQSGGIVRTFVNSITVDGRTLQDWCENGNIHPHRFRKTVARLAALSLVGATSILFDILGHRDVEMTLNYILSDPDLQDEIRKIATEANVMLSKGAIEYSDSNGGTVAPLVSDLKQRLTARSGEDEIGVSTLAEAAEILSMNGQVSMVKASVLCLKSVGQVGACTRRAGIPDVANCSTACGFRLEHSAAEQDCANSIEQILAEMPSSDESMMRTWWQAQLVAHVRRFPKVKIRYLSDRRVQAALEGIDAGVMGALSLNGNCAESSK